MRAKEWEKLKWDLPGSFSLLLVIRHEIEDEMSQGNIKKLKLLKILVRYENVIGIHIIFQLSSQTLL